MFLNISRVRNDRQSKETSEVTGESDWSSFLIPCTFIRNRNYTKELIDLLKIIARKEHVV